MSRQYAKINLDAVESAVRASLMEEVRTTPKPGLVDLHDNGAHKDMNAGTFERSTAAVAPFLREMFSAGLDGAETRQPEETFLEIRRIGMEAERAMFLATDHVNTHKGMIFTMGTVLAAAGRVIGAGTVCAGGSEPGAAEAFAEAVLRTAGEMTRDVLAAEFENMKNKVPETHGEKLFHATGERGIRGQAAAGFPILRDTAFPALLKYRVHFSRGEAEELGYDLFTGEGCQLDSRFINSGNINVLLSVMAVLDDTNVLTRSNAETMHWLQGEAAAVLRRGGAFTKAGLRSVTALNDSCIRRNISPGGAADILAVALLLEKLTGGVFLQG